MRRGDVRLTDLDPARGSAAGQRRPAIVVSNDRANATAARLGRGVLTVIPITSNVRRVFGFQVSLPSGLAGLRVDSKAQCEQVRAVSVQRLGASLGRLPASIMGEVDEALRLHLQL